MIILSYILMLIIAGLLLGKLLSYNDDRRTFNVWKDSQDPNIQKILRAKFPNWYKEYLVREINKLEK